MKENDPGRLDYHRTPGLPTVYRGQELPISFHIFTDFWYHEPKPGQIIGFNSFGGDLVWMQDADGTCSVHNVSRRSGDLY